MAKKHKPKGRRGNGGTGGQPGGGSKGAGRKKRGGRFPSGSYKSHSNHQADESEVSLPSNHKNHKMSLKREAWLTSQHREYSGGRLREMPIVFVKSTEVYDPSKLDWDPVNKKMRKIEEAEEFEQRRRNGMEIEIEMDKGILGIEDSTENMTIDNELTLLESSLQIIREDEDDNLVDGDVDTEEDKYTQIGPISLDLDRTETATSEKDIALSSEDEFDIEGPGDDEKSETSSVSVLQNISTPGSASGSGSWSFQQREVPAPSAKSSLYRTTNLSDEIDSHEFSLDTAGIADDEDEEDIQSSSSVSDDEDDSNHSSDMEYEQLIGLRRLALRDLDIGGSLEDGYDELSQDADSSSNNEDYSDEEEDDDEDEDEDEHDQNDVYREHQNNYESDTEPLPPGPVIKILRTQYGTNGKEFLVEWSHEYESIRDSNYIDEEEFFELYQDHGYTNEKIFSKIKSLGGTISDDEDDEEIAENDLYFEDTKGTDDFVPSGDELDAIIARLVGSDNDNSSKRKKKSQDSILESFASSILTTPKKPKKGKVPNFEVSDDEIRDYLEKQWVRSREAKRIRKEKREQLRKEGGLKKQKPISTDVTNLRRRYPVMITVSEVVDEIKNFISNETTTTIEFPPVDHNARYIIKRICQAFYLSPSTRGKGLGKFVMATRTSSSYGSFSEEIVSSFLNRRKTFPYTDTKAQEKVRNKKPNELKHQKRNGGGGIVHHKEGDIVGGTADELGADNIGRIMLEKMGWKSGMGLGTTTVGIIEPISAKVKKTKWGIGMDI